MDYDFRIKLLEIELKALRELGDLMRLRQDGADDRMIRQEELMEKLLVTHEATLSKLDNLINVLTRQQEKE